MEHRLDALRLEYATVSTRISPLVEISIKPLLLTSELETLRRKWDETALEWNTAIRDAEVLGDELKEDQWLVIFRTVAEQAADMMDSLDKVLYKSTDFIARLPAPPPLSTTIAGMALQEEFGALTSGLTAKIKYYAPSVERVLKTLGKGIAGRMTKNGEVLRGFGEMKLRWERLSERITTTEARLDEVYAALTRPPKASTELLSNRRQSALPSLPKVNSRASFSAAAPRPPSALGLSLPPSTPTPRPFKSSTPRYSTTDPPVARARTPRLSAAFLMPPDSHSPSKPRPRSPNPPLSSSATSRPRWDISTRPVPDRDPPPLHKSLGASASGAFDASSNGRASALGSHRSSSRLSMGRSMASLGIRSRASSPTLSDAATIASAHPRPSTPASRIPAPISARRQSMIPNLEASPPPAAESMVSPTKARSRLPRRSSMAPLYTAASSASRPLSPTAHAYDRSHTPEPHISPTKRSSVAPRSPAPPVPSIPALHRIHSLAPSRPFLAADDLYDPNHLDPLDVAISLVVNALPYPVYVDRLDPPLLHRAPVGEIPAARYYIGAESNKAVLCKLVDRLGARARGGQKRVLVRSRTGWVDLETLVKQLMDK